MNIEVFVVAHFDQGKLCLTNSFPQAKTVGGVEYVFTDELVKLDLPSREMEPLEQTIRQQKTKVEYFDKLLTPGRALSQKLRLQGSMVEVFVFNDSDVGVLSFVGYVENFEYNIEECKCTFVASTQRKSTEINFPPGSLLEEGRFVERLVINPQDYNEDYYSQRIQYLSPVVEFVSVVGTPSAPAGDYSYETVNIPISANDFAHPMGAYLFFDDKASDLAIPVIYGENNNVALNILGHYRAVSGKGGAVKIYIAIVAGHVVGGDPLLTSFSGDFGVSVKSDNMSLTSVYGMFGLDRLNSDFSYLTIPVFYDDATFENLLPIYPSNFDIYQAFITTIVGKLGPASIPISGLSDVISDLWMSYGGRTAIDVDWRTVSESSDELNSFEVSMVVNNKTPNQTLLDLLSERFQGQFPVVFGFPLGKLAWQSALFINPQSTIPGAKEIKFGLNALSRGSIEETKVSKIVNSLKVSFGINGNSGEDENSISLTRENSDIARTSQDRWGISKLSEMRVPDTVFADVAVKVGINSLLKSAGVRFTVSYVLDDISFLSLPFMTIVSVNDEQAGFIDEPFYFLGFKWGKDLSNFSVSLLSVKMI